MIISFNEFMFIFKKLYKRKRKGEEEMNMEDRDR